MVERSSHTMQDAAPHRTDAAGLQSRLRDSLLGSGAARCLVSVASLLRIGLEREASSAPHHLLKLLHRDAHRVHPAAGGGCASLRGAGAARAGAESVRLWTSVRCEMERASAEGQGGQHALVKVLQHQFPAPVVEAVVAVGPEVE